MLYVIEIYTTAMGTKLYRLYETHTGSQIQMNSASIRNLIENTGVTIINLKIDKLDNIVQHSWPNKAALSGMAGKIADRSVLLKKLGEDKFKMIEYTGDTEYINSETLKHRIDNNAVSNCAYIEHEYKCINTLNIVRDLQFEHIISEQYKQFILKSSVLGLDNSFKYCIEGNEVQLLKYTGHSNRIVIPNFITTIYDSAFRSTNIVNVKFNDTLKHIGNYAFCDTQILSVEIPESVELKFLSTFMRGVTIKLLGYNTKTIGVKQV